jgi:hypothetical protein
MPLNRFGIKEVADVKFYDVLSDVSAAAAVAAVADAVPVIEFDTLKVSNIESTAESSEARGGKGNAALISWDYGREITVTLEDALMSMESLALLFENTTTNTDGSITINANTFPGTYTVVGTTYARNESDGKDHIFKFVIPKAKIQSETTLTMEAEGDPSVLGMTLKVLRCKNGDMMELIRETNPVTENTSSKVHVTLVDADGAVSGYYLTAGAQWPSGISTSNYEGMPSTVAGGTYYEKA